VTTCIKFFYVSGKAKIFTLVESSWFAFKAFDFGLLLGVILCSGILLVVLGTTN